MVPVLDSRRAGSRFDALTDILNFFIPAEVLSAVLLVFTMENVLDHLFTSLVPSGAGGATWVVVYVLSVIAISGLNYATADEEEREELGDDLDDL